MRISALLFAFLFTFLSVIRSEAQTQNPGAAQDAEAAREKLLNAADQLDNIQANSESTKLSVDSMKSDVTKLQADVQALQAENATLKQQLADMQAALDHSEAARVKDRQTLIDNVAAMLAAGKAGGDTKPAKKKTEDPAPVAPTTDVTPSASNLAPPPDPGSPVVTPPAPKPQKGYYHVVVEGETLKLICDAYRDNGVKVTVAQIRKANGLAEGSVLKPGQKLFIPKPGA